MYDLRSHLHVLNFKRFHLNLELPKLNMNTYLNLIFIHKYE